MLAVEVPADGLRRIKFGWSMLGETTRSLWAASRTDQPLWIQRWWREVQPVLPRGQLMILQELIPPSGQAFIPEFMLPAPTGRPPSLDEELHALVSTPLDAVREEMTAVIAGLPEQGIAAMARPLTMRALDSRGEAGYLQVLADQLEAYWHTAIGPYWPRLRSGLDRELDHRGRMLATQGIDSVLGDLSPRLAWHNDHLIMRVSLQEQRKAAAGIWFDCSAFLYDRLIQGRKPDGTEQISYAMRGSGAAWAAQPKPSDALVDLLGPVRAAVLADLREPGTTAALSQRHRLPPSTVSYHLGVLYRAGLAERHREGKHVHYRRSPLGDRLMNP